MQLSVGQIYAGRYRVVRQLGDGAMGAVYEAENVLIRRHVAIKVLHPHVAERQDARVRFEREAQAAGRIGSPHIVEVLDMGELDGGARFLVMELLEGTTLAQRVRDAGRLSPDEAAPIVIQLLAGLGAAHAADIVHRDLKPANVFLAGNRSVGDYVKILDFGVSKFAVAGDDMGMTGAGSVLGTPFYMSPEQAKGARHIDHRSDLYAVGVILYECVTGKVPFEAETLNELIFRIVLEAPPPVESLVAGLDPAFTAIVRKAMAREAGERFQSAREMHDALVRWLAPARPGVGFDTSSTLLWAAAPPHARARKTGERAFVLGLLATLALGGATLFAVRPHGSDIAGTKAAAPSVAAAAPAPPPRIEPAPASAQPSAAPPVVEAPAPTAPAPAPPAATASAGARITRPAIVPRPKPSAVVVPAKRTVPDEL
jgi:tRNA A-37 threonylcarbamoyl transferase component Bud32